MAVGGGGWFIFIFLRQKSGVGTEIEAERSLCARKETAKKTSRKLTDFLFSFFSFTVALFRREWQVAYRTEMSTNKSQH